jgi:hypothetical protein
MTSRIAAVVVLAVLALLPAALLLGDDKTQLTIQVLDVKDRPVPKASVTVTFVTGRNIVLRKQRAEWSMKTSSKGTAELPDIPSGKVRLQVIAQGYKTYGDEFEISGKEMTHTVKLERPSGKQFSVHEEPESEKKPEQKKPEGVKK